MTFLIAAWYSSFCLAMIFAWKADHLSSLHPQYSRNKIPLACGWKYWKNQMVLGVHLAASRQSRAATFQRGCDVINRWIIGIRNFAKCCWRFDEHIYCHCDIWDYNTRYIENLNVPKYFQAPTTQDSTSPLTSTSGSATDMISIQPQNNTFVFFKKKKESSRPEWTQDKSSHFILLYFHTVFHYNYKNPITYDFLVGTSRLFPVASYSVPQPQQKGGQKKVCGFSSALLACNKSM